MADVQANKLIERINQDMRQAMKNREHIRLNELRSLLARISNAGAVTPEDDKVEAGSPIAGAMEGVGSTETPRKRLTLAEVRSIVLAEMHEIETVLEGLDKTSEYAAELREKIAAIRKYG